MKFLILAAGYGSRLQRDIEHDTSGKYQHLLHTPKPLIPLAGQPLAAWHVQDILQCGYSIGDVYVITNDQFHQQFVQFANAYGVPPQNVINDGSRSNDTRIGAISDIALIVRHLQRTSSTAEPLVVLGGDTLIQYSAGSNLQHLLQQATAVQQSCVLYYKCPTEQLSISGILEVDAADAPPRVTTFLEKPTPEQTESRLACPCWYLLHPRDFHHILQYVDANNDDLQKVDAPGNLVKHLLTVTTVRALQIDERTDIGNLQTYIEADAYVNKNYKATLKPSTQHSN